MFWTEIEKKLQKKKQGLAIFEILGLQGVKRNSYSGWGAMVLLTIKKGGGDHPYRLPLSSSIPYV